MQPAIDWTPGEALRRRVQDETALAFLFVTSRSGSTLIQTLLDGHPQVLQHPNFFKYFDFIAACPSLYEMTATEAARAFAAFPAHVRLFDTATCHVYGGRIGADLKARVFLDRDAFVEACAACLPETGFDARDLLYAIQVAFAWQLGYPIGQAKVCLQHIHHGDWLWPETVRETYNLSPPPSQRGIDLVRPDKIIISNRNPVETLGSLERLVAVGGGSDDEKERLYGVYYRLYVQDVLRQGICKASGVPTMVVDLKDLRQRTGDTMRDLAAFLDIDRDHPGLLHPTAFGLPWFGDRASAVSHEPQEQEPITPLRPDWREEAALIVAVGDLVEARGGRLARAIRRWRARRGMIHGRMPRRAGWRPSPACSREVADLNDRFIRSVIR